MKPIPKNKKLYKKVLKEASKKFKSPSGVYRSAWIVREYLKRGGTYSSKRKPNSRSPGLRRWFREEWVDITTGKSCGRKSSQTRRSRSRSLRSPKRSLRSRYPVCRPKKRISKSTPKTVSEISKKSLRKAIHEKQRVRERGNIQFGRGPQDVDDLLERLRQEQIIRELLKKKQLEEKKIEKEAKKKRREELKQKFKHRKKEIKERVERERRALGLDDRAPGLDDRAPGLDDQESKELRGGKPQFRGYRSKKMIPVPQKVKKWAKYFFVLKKLGFKGAIETGNKRAKQLATKDSIPIEDLRYMRNWYARHIITSYPTFKRWNESGRPKGVEWHNKRGIQAWNSWGGNAGFRWVNSSKTIKMLNNYFGTNYTKIKTNI